MMFAVHVFRLLGTFITRNNYYELLLDVKNSDFFVTRYLLYRSFITRNYNMLPVVIRC